jgi:septal ring factor EnvC (AmiA/AmiB activator)
MKQFFTFDNIYKIVVIIAIGYLIFSVLSIFNLSSKNIDKIDKAQQEIMQSAKDIMARQEKALQKADSIDQIRIDEIKKLTTEVSSLKGQIKTVEREITSYKKTFEQNKIDLPNPWKE